jgi:hypothetical protein
MTRRRLGHSYNRTYVAPYCGDIGGIVRFSLHIPVNGLLVVEKCGGGGALFFLFGNSDILFFGCRKTLPPAALAVFSSLREN